MRPLTLQDFDYPFPEHLIAQHPADARENARLLVRSVQGPLKELHVSDFTSEIPSDALLILNDTRVFPSRLIGKLPTGGRVELFLLEEEETNGCDDLAGVWIALGRPLKKLKPGTKVFFPKNLEAEVIDRTQHDDGSAQIKVRLSLSGTKLASWLDEHAGIPLPPYIKRAPDDETLRDVDRVRYQTVYARERGSVAAPTAGLHFTQKALKALEAAGVTVRYVSLHVGAGTFLPVKSEDISQHRMHRERYYVPSTTIDALVKARESGRKVVAVGTTTFRCLESLYRLADAKPEHMLALADRWHATELFVYPTHADETYAPWVIDGLMTNFHQPCSTLFMLISALIGLNEAKALYADAVKRQFRLYSFGDTSLLWLR